MDVKKLANEHASKFHAQGTRDHRMVKNHFEDGFELALSMVNTECPNCGCSEMLCGHKGVGCVSDNQTH